jgi:hypothetical protein
MLNFDALPERVELPADLAAILYETMKEHGEWDLLHHMRAELGTQKITIPPHMAVVLFDKLVDQKEMNVMTEMYRTLKSQGA